MLRNVVALRGAIVYVRHALDFSFAGFALQRGPAFSLPGTGLIDW
jgi:hypothetical protein